MPKTIKTLAAACAIVASLGASAIASAAPDLASEMSLQFSRHLIGVLQSGQGDARAAQLVGESADQFPALLELAMHGGQYENCTYAPASPLAQDRLRSIADGWEFFQRGSEAIRQGQPVMEQIAGAVNTITKNQPSLLELSEQVAAFIALNNGSTINITTASRLSFLTERLDDSTRRMLAESFVNPEAAFLMGKDTNQFRDLVQGLLNGSPVLHTTPTKGLVRDKLNEIVKLLQSDTQARDIILNNLQTLITVKAAVRMVVGEPARSERLLQQLRDLHDKLPPGQDCH